MAYSTKAAQLKQTFSFKSLRLMEKKDSLERLKSFSDTEINELNDVEVLNQNMRIKSISESALNINSEINEKETLNNVQQSSVLSAQAKLQIQKIKLDSNKTLNSSIIEISSQVPVKSSIENTNDNTSKDLVSRAAIKSKIKMRNIEPTFLNQKPYEIFEDNVVTENSHEHILGEPRCLTLKKYSGDIDPFLTDDSLTFHPDLEQNNRFLKQIMSKHDKKHDSNLNEINDMFLDEDGDKCGGKNCAAIDREEGELSPDVQHSPEKEDKTYTGNIETKSDKDFFNETNKLLCELDKKCKDFYETCVPESCVKHLQITLKNVDSIKRKLVFLLNSRNLEVAKKNKIKKVDEEITSSKSIDEIKAKSEQCLSVKNKNTSNSNNRENDIFVRHRSLHSKDNDDSQLKFYNDDIKSYFSENKEIRSKRSDKHRRHSQKRRSSRNKPSQTELLKRKKLSILEKIGTKTEIQRIQSLFKRQMSLITQHVIQKKETGRLHHREEDEKSKIIQHSEKQDHIKNVKNTINLNNIKTLEDMEAFLESLKNGANDKIACERYLSDTKRKQSLKFTTKKKNSLNFNLGNEKQQNFPFSQNKHENLFEKDHQTTTPFKNTETLNQNKILDNSGRKSKSTITSISEIHQEKGNESMTSDFKQSEIIYKSSAASDPFTNVSTSKINVGVIEKSKTNENAENIKEKGIDHNTVDQKDISIKNKKRCSSLEKNGSNNTGRKENSSHHDYSNFDKAIYLRRRGNIKRKMDEYLDKKSAESENGNIEFVHKQRKTVKQDISYDKTPTPVERKYKSTEVFTNKPDIENSSSNQELEANTDELVKDLLSKKVFIIDDNNVISNSQFCMKIIGNEIYLKRVSKKRKHSNSKKYFNSDQIKYEHPCSETNSEMVSSSKRQEINTECNTSTLEEMEQFLEELRSKKKVLENEQHKPIDSNSQTREIKFLARIQAKRKAKLMACVSADSNRTEKEAKFLKVLEKRDKEICESSDIESRKQKLIEKIRAETDAIVLANKPGAKQNVDDDPLIDVKKILNMIKEAESINEESSKQDYVSFSLKRSDVKRLENITTRKASGLNEESQKFLNGVRAKIRAKKAPVSNISALMLKPDL